MKPRTTQRNHMTNTQRLKRERTLQTNQHMTMENTNPEHTETNEDAGTSACAAQTDYQPPQTVPKQQQVAQ
eukprot:12904438-Prorocentrum_lima.AAC.1